MEQTSVLFEQAVYGPRTSFLTAFPFTTPCSHASNTLSPRAHTASSNLFLSSMTIPATFVPEQKTHFAPGSAR